MPTDKIFFGNDQRSGDHELAGASPLAVNVVVDQAGTVRRRPGISLWDGFPADAIPEASPVIGMYAYEGRLVYVNANRHFYRLTPAAAAVEDLSTGGGTSFLGGSGRPIFTETPFRLVIAGGGQPEKLDRTEVVMERLGGGPPASSHIVYQFQRLILDDQDTAISGTIRTADPRGDVWEEDWNALSLVVASSKPDRLVALYTNSNELYAFGERTLQVFTPTGEENHASGLAPQRAVNRGCSAPYSIIESDESFAWLDEKRRFLSSDGREVEEVSAPIAKTLRDMATVDDCFGFRWIADQYDALCWVFPTDGRTFVVQSGGGWAQWHGWTVGQGHTRFPIESHYYWPEENLHLVGLEDGRIAQLDSAAHDDLGAIIKAEVATGFINHGTSAYKHCELVRFIFKRGHTSSATVEPVVLLSWRDNLGAFCSPVRLGLGTANEPVFSVEKRSLGTYRSRQWKLEFTDALDYVLVRCEETFTVSVREGLAYATTTKASRAA